MDSAYLRLGFWLRFIAASLVGASIMHLAEYHLGLGLGGDAGDRVRWIAWMLQHCPMRAPLAVVTILFLVVSSVTGWSMWRQIQKLRQLSSTPPTQREMVRRHRLRPMVGVRTVSMQTILFIFALLAATQWIIFSVAMHLVPMETVMRMRGHEMVMGATPPMAPILLALVIASVGTLLLCRFESAVEAIALAIEACLRTLFAQVRSDALPGCPTILRPIMLFLGPALFSRPPPKVLAA